MPQYETRIMARQRELLNQRRSPRKNVGAVNKNTNGLSLKRQYLDTLRRGKDNGRNGFIQGNSNPSENEIPTISKVDDPCQGQLKKIESKIQNEKLGKKERKMAIRRAKGNNGQGKSKSYFITGLDCRTPQSVKHGLLSEVCGAGNRDTAGGTAVPETVSILQYSTKHVVSGVRCTKRVSAINEICGSFSHSMILEPQIF